MTTPLDGDLDDLRRFADTLRHSSATFADAASELASTGAAADPIWKGDAATSWQSHLAKVQPPMRLAERDLSTAAEIVRRHANELADLRERYRHATRERDEAERKRGWLGGILDDAKHVLADCERNVARAIEAEAAAAQSEAVANAAGTTSGAHQQAQTDRSKAQAEARSAASKLRQHAAELDRSGAAVRAAEARVAQLMDEYRQLIRSTSRALDDLDVVTEADRQRATRYRDLDDPGQSYQVDEGAWWNPFDDKKIHDSYPVENYYDHPLFGPGGPSPDDINQGSLGDCWAVAALIAVAKTDPGRIERLITDNGDGTYTVHLATGDQVVDADLPTKDGGPAYARLGRGGSTWVAIVEKAYAQSRQDSYHGIHGGNEREALKQIFGIESDHGSPSDHRAAFQAAIRAGKPATASVDMHDLIPSYDEGSNHALAVVGVSGSGPDAIYTIRNPWNGTGFSGTFQMSAREFESKFYEVTHGK